MPKLNPKQQKVVDAAESGGFLKPTGRYLGTLVKVEEKPGRVAPQWSWRFESLVLEDQGPTGGALFVNTSLSDKAAWKMKEVFEALGYSSDSDTDEMIGEKAVLIVIQEKQTEGQNAGQMVNRVTKVEPYLEDEMPEFDFDASAAAPAEGDGF